MADKNTLLALNATNIPDNNNKEASPADVREVNEQVIGSNANLDELTEQEFSGPVKFSGGVSGVGIDNRVIINQFSDFPEPLESDTQYYIGGNVVLPDILPASWASLPQNIELAGSVVASKITWNGTGILFNGADLGRFKIVNVLLSAPNAALYNIVDTVGATIVNLISASVESCDEIGVLNAFGVVMDTINIASTNKGVTIGDKVKVLNISALSSTSPSATYVHLDLADSAMKTFEVVNNEISAPIGAVFISGLTGSQNILENQRGSVSSCELDGGMSALNGLTEDDVRFDFRSVTGVRDSNPDALITLTNNAVATVITASSVDGSNAVLAAGAWIEKDSSQYATTAQGKISALFEYVIPSPITATLTVEPVSGTNKTIAAYIAIDGVVQVESGQIARVDNNDPKSLTVIWQEEMSNNQNTNVEVYLENRTDNTNILGSNLVLRVR